MIGSKIKSRAVARGGRKYTHPYGSIFLGDIDIEMYLYESSFVDSINIGETIHVGNAVFESNVMYFGIAHPMNCAAMPPYFYNEKLEYDVKNVECSTLTVRHDV